MGEWEGSFRFARGWTKDRHIFQFQAGLLRPSLATFYFWLCIAYNRKTTTRIDCSIGSTEANLVIFI